MHFHSALLVTITVVLVLSVSGSTKGYGLECWACSSIVDRNCAEDFYFGMPDSTILKKNCWELPRLEGKRNVNATSCTKIVIKDHRSTIVNRGCGFPNEFGQSPSEPLCKSLSLRGGYGHDQVDTHVEICTCSESYCNGSVKHSLKSAIILLVGILVISQLYLYPGSGS